MAGKDKSTNTTGLHNTDMVPLPQLNDAISCRLLNGQFRRPSSRKPELLIARTQGGDQWRETDR